jgi:hypothetical protein
MMRSSCAICVLPCGSMRARLFRDGCGRLIATPRPRCVRCAPLLPRGEQPVGTRLPNQEPQYASTTPIVPPSASEWVRSYPEGQWVYHSGEPDHARNAIVCRAVRLRSFAHDVGSPRVDIARLAPNEKNRRS